MQFVEGGHGRRQDCSQALIQCISKALQLEQTSQVCLNPLNAELNPTCRLLALFGAHHILHVSRIRVNTYNNGLA